MPAAARPEPWIARAIPAQPQWSSSAVITPNCPSGSAPIRCMCSRPCRPHLRASLITSQGVLSSSSCLRATGRMTSRANLRTWSLCSRCSSVRAKSISSCLLAMEPRLIDWSVSQSTRPGSGTCHLPHARPRPQGAASATSRVAFAAVRLPHDTERDRLGPLRAARRATARPGIGAARWRSRSCWSSRSTPSAAAASGETRVVTIAVATDNAAAGARRGRSASLWSRRGTRPGSAGRTRPPTPPPPRSRPILPRPTPRRSRRRSWCRTTTGRPASPPRSSPARRCAPGADQPAGCGPGRHRPGAGAARSEGRRGLRRHRRLLRGRRLGALGVQVRRDARRLARPRSPTPSTSSASG